VPNPLEHPAHLGAIWQNNGLIEVAQAQRANGLLLPLGMSNAADTVRNP
jgi:hypothetical protein